MGFVEMKNAIAEMFKKKKKNMFFARGYQYIDHERRNQ